jgi:hypothetical protein
MSSPVLLYCIDVSNEISLAIPMLVPHSVALQLKEEDSYYHITGKKLTLFMQK